MSLPGGRSAPRALGLLLTCLLLVPGGPVRAADDPGLAGVQVELRDGTWIVSYVIEGAFSGKTRDRIASGLPVTFRSFLEVRKRGIFKSKLQVHTLDVTVDFDSLTKQYRLSRQWDEQLVASSATEKEEEMNRWMTEVRELELGLPPDECADLEPFLRVKARVDSSFAAIFFPYHKETGWARVPLPCAPEEADEG